MATEPRTLTFSLTQTRHFRRLVDFLSDVERIADERCDLELREAVEACRDDLLRESRDGD